MKKLWFVLVFVLSIVILLFGVYYFLFYSKGYPMDSLLSYKFLSKFKELSFSDLENSFLHDAIFMSIYSFVLAFLFFLLGWIFSGIGKKKPVAPVAVQQNDNSGIESELQEWKRKYQELYDLSQGTKVELKKPVVEKISHFKSSVNESRDTPKTTPKDSHDLGVIEGLHSKYLSVLRLNDIHTFSDLAKASASVLNLSIKKITGDTVDSQKWIDQAKNFL